MSGENPYVGKVVDLVNPYMTQDSNTSGGGREAEGGEYALWWLRTHPGRWALVAEGKVGIPIAILQKAGMRTSMTQKNKTKVNYKLYAQYPHPKGEDIKEALARTMPPRLELPEVTKSDFNWTPAELADAVYVMRQNLFPAEEGEQPVRIEPVDKRGGARGRSPHARIR